MTIPFIQTRALRAIPAAVAIVLMASLLLAACTGKAPVAPSGETAPINISDAWVRPAEQGGTTAVYFVLHNKSDTDAVLHDVAAPSVTDEAMLHESKTVDNIMTMDHVHVITVPAKGALTLEPGGYHVMLMDIKHELQVGDSVRLTLYFTDLGPLEFEIDVQDQ